MKPTRFLLGLASLVLSLAASALQAQTLVSTLGTGPSSSYTSYNQSAASFLTVGGTASYSISGIDYSLYTDSGANVTFTLSFYSDNNGNIGSLLYTADPLSLSGDGRGHVESLNFTTPCSLQGGNAYWLMMTADTGNVSGFTFADTPTVSNYGWSVGATKMIFPGWSMNTGSQPEYTIKGTVIPEPSTYALLVGAASIGVALWRRRRT